MIKINKGFIELASQDIIPYKWDEFYLFLFENDNWRFVDFLAGEIIDKVSAAELHHNNGDKKNNKEKNLFYLLKKNHGIITSAQKYWPALATFFEELLESNRNSLLRGKIPKSWRIGWRILAIEQGFTFPKGKYLEKPGDKIL